MDQENLAVGRPHGYVVVQFRHGVIVAWYHWTASTVGLNQAAGYNLAFPARIHAAAFCDSHTLSDGSVLSHCLILRCGGGF